MKAIILAGGLGSRLRPFTEVIPKPLLPIGEKALMEIQIEKLANCGFDTVFVASNYKSDYVEAFLGDGKKYGVKIIYSKEEKPLGTAGPVSLLKDELKEGFILMNGDILTKLDFKELYEFGEKQPSILTIGTKIISTPFRFGNVFSDENNFVTGVEEKPNFQLEILAGIYYMNPEIFNVIPEDTYYGMDILIKDMLAKDLRISKYLIKDYWLDIGQIEDYSKANEIYKEHFHTAKNDQL